MGVTVIGTDEDFQTKVIGEKTKLVVVDFFAEWCGPCRMIAPELVKLSDELADVLFFKVDVDQLEELAAKADVSAMPTFHFYKSGSKVAEVVGASLDKIKEQISKYK